MQCSTLASIPSFFTSFYCLFLPILDSFISLQRSSVMIVPGLRIITELGLERSEFPIFGVNLVVVEWPRSLVPSAAQSPRHYQLPKEA